jgi:hypothetical protein
VSAIPKAVPSAVAPTAQRSVKVLTDPQLGPYKGMTGSSIIPVVPVPDGAPNPEDANLQPGYGGGVGGGSYLQAGSQGAPTVPAMGGVLFTSPPIDSHYVSEAEVKSPYAKVNNPPTRGRIWSQRIQAFTNHIALTNQNVDPNGFRISPDQQRTSVMRNTLPPNADGYSPETYQPGQRPQSPNTAKYMPATGTQAYGTGVLNSDTYGAGQTAGGIGGNLYTPTPGPPPSTSTADNSSDASGMPTWG